MTEGLVFECFYTRRYRPLRCKMTTFMAVIFLWQFPPLFFAISPKNSSYSPPLFLLFRPNGLDAAQAPPASGKQRQNGVGRPAGARPDTKKRQPFRLSLFWSGKRGSDPRPQPWQGCALPTELFPRWECKDRCFFENYKIFFKNFKCLGRVWPYRGLL